MPDAGLFSPDSVTWRVHREGALLLGGGRALIMQVAHPLVAAGVGEHSGYRADPWGRLYRTIDLYTSMIFRTRAELDAARARLWRIHGGVRGVVRHAGGSLPLRGAVCRA